MRFFGKSAAVVVAALGMAPAAYAEGIGGELNVARANEDWGAELGIGYQLDLGPIALRPIAGGFVHQADGFYRDTFANGQSRCRNESNGQFASDASCIQVDWYAKAEAAFVTRAGLELGGGARFSNEKTSAYGMIAFRVSPKLKVQASGGDSFIAGGLRLGF